jgi:probable phosphoglycerate mutase
MIRVAQSRMALSGRLSNVKLFVVRHGQTDYNAQRRFQGQADIPLNETGKDQARRAGLVLQTLLEQHLAREKSTHGVDIVCSDLLRTQQTADIIRESLKQVAHNFQLDARLREFHCGVLENNTYEEFVLKNPEIATTYMSGFDSDSYNTRYPGEGGESRVDVMVRVGESLHATAQRIQKNKICVWVAHGGVIDVLLELMHIQLPKSGSDRISAGNGDVLIFTPTKTQKSISEQSLRLGHKDCWELEKHYKIGNTTAARVVR